MVKSKAQPLQTNEYTVNGIMRDTSFVSLLIGKSIEGMDICNFENNEWHILKSLVYTDDYFCHTNVKCVS